MTTEITIPEAITLMRDYLTPDCPFIVAGPPGIGKTDAAQQVAEATGRKFVATHPITSEPTDYRGMPHVNGNGAEWLPIGMMRALTDPACPPTVCLVDDIGQCQDDVQAAVMHVMLARQIGDYPIADTVSFVACTNGTEHGAGARSLLSPLVTRGVLLHTKPDNLAFARHAIHAGDCHPLIAAYAISRPDLFSSSYERDGRQICTPRGLMKLGKIMHRSPASYSLPSPILCGAIGDERGEDMTLFLMEAEGNGGMLDNPAQLENVMRLKVHGMMSFVVAMAAWRSVQGKDVSHVTKLLRGDWRESFDTLIAE